jgi:hypothetical protein
MVVQNSILICCFSKSGFLAAYFFREATFTYTKVLKNTVKLTEILNIHFVKFTVREDFSALFSVSRGFFF